MNWSSCGSSACQWTWVLAALGAGHRWLNRDSALLRYACQAVYPFYILHLPMATLIAYFVVQTSLAPALKYTIIVVLAVGLTLAVYELAVRRVNVLRLCLGLKPSKPAAPPVVAAPRWQQPPSSPGNRTRSDEAVRSGC